MVVIRDTLNNKKKELQKRPFSKGHIGLFVCGPTVYDYSHIGHARTYIAFDFIAKYLRFRGFKNLYYLQNITDIDDKIIVRAKKEKKDPIKLAESLTKEYLKDMETLGISAVNHYARATKFIPHIAKQVERLIDKGYGYQIAGDGYYFDIAKFKDYGKLSRRTVQQAEDAVSRIDETAGKHNRGDFCLWKFYKPGEPSWKSSLGRGRPGWHIEDTAISEYYFGSQYDLHGGGVDLKFPHHEAEIAQQEAASGKKPFVRIWIHTGMLTARGVKMSKSLRNFITIRDFLRKFSPEVLRFFILSFHYRSPLNYTEKGVVAFQQSLSRLISFVVHLKEPVANFGNKKDLTKEVRALQQGFYTALDDDFMTPKAFGLLFSFIRKAQPNVENLSPATRKLFLALAKDIESFTGIGLLKKTSRVPPNAVKKLLRAREAFRREKKWKEADRIRVELERHGWQVQDKSSGPRLLSR